MIGALHKKVFPDHTRREKHQLVVFGQGLGSDEPDDLLQFSFMLESYEGLVSYIAVIGTDLVPPCVNRIGVETVALEPVDGRKVSLVGEGDIQ